jgi:RND family efflux transporter MFP subunit
MNQSNLVRTFLILALVLVAAPYPFAADEPNLGEIVLETKGYVVPVNQITVGPRVAGQVIESRIEEGRRVKAGDILARLYPAEYEAAARLARAELKLAELDAKDGKPKTDIEIEIAKAKVELAQARLTLAQNRLDATVIRAPINGTILLKRADVGTLINPSATQGSTSLCEMADLRNVEVELWVQERDVAKIEKGQKCQVRLEAFPQKNYRGSVARLLPIADKARGAVGIRVRVEIPKDDESFRPEMAAVVAIGPRNS